MKLILFHGTSAENAKKIEQEGFATDKSYNWEVTSQKGFVYLSTAYAPFYAMKHDTNDLALVKVEVDSKDLFPEDDFIMFSLGKPKYEQADLEKISKMMPRLKHLWMRSLSYLGNVAIRPNKIKVLGIRYFDEAGLVMKCDPVISTMNYKIMGNYYKELSHWIFDGKNIAEFRSESCAFMNPITREEFDKKIEEQNKK